LRDLPVENYFEIVVGIAKSSRRCFTAGVLLDLFRQAPNPPAALRVDEHLVAIAFVQNRRARRYILRVHPGPAIRVTVPARGSKAEAWAFLQRHRQWINQQIRHQAAAAPLRETDTMRDAVERHLWNRARSELVARTLALAAQHNLLVKRVTVRNQRSRWGSCSRRGTISLNWRLIQMPDSVRDYIVLHELMHLREHNHSARFWHQVEQVCPDYLQAEKWLKQHRHLLR